MKKMVSIIVPMYNVEKYILRCLKSIEQQSYKNIEVICIDDGSTDETYNIVKTWKTESSLRVILEKFENKGVSAARNEGILQASGDYICFVDSDDMLREKYVETLVGTLEMNTECDVVICKKENVDEEEDENYCNTKERVGDKTKTYYMTSYIMLKKMLYHEITAGIWNLLIRKEVLVDNNLSFPVGYAYSEDLQLTWKIVACSRNVAFVPKELYLYRIRKNSAMAKFDERRKDGYELFKQLAIFLNEKRPEFAMCFNKYGISYWVWSTMWQAVKFSESFDDFIDKIEDYNAAEHMWKLLMYPDVRVKVTSALFLVSKRAYYKFMISILKRKREK